MSELRGCVKVVAECVTAQELCESRGGRISELRSCVKVEAAVYQSSGAV